MKTAGLIALMFAMQLTTQNQQTVTKLTPEQYKGAKSPLVSKNAYVLSGSIWRDSSTIFVCWENPSTAFAEDMATVKEAISETWQAVSQLNFVGWQQCAPQNAGIRILVDDSGPHTAGLGRNLNGMRNGMTLNFSFRNWSPDCQNTHRYCVYAIAVHEFGHAIGFAHEQNRADAPGECRQQSQGSGGDLLLTPYDPGSVMNYCNAQWNNNGQLSRLDVAAVEELYGTR